MSAGYSSTPLARKLGIKEGHRLATLGAPPHFEGLLDPLPPHVDVENDPLPPHVDVENDPLPPHGDVELDPPRLDRFDVIVAFVPTADELPGRFARGRRLLETSGGLWIAWPKQSSLLATDFRERDVRAHGLESGLVDNKICAIDDDWSGLRFVVRLEDRPAR